MTTYKQSFDLGTAAATITSGNSGGAGLTAFNSVVIGGGSFVYSSADFAHGTQCGLISGASGVATNGIFSGISSTAMSWSIYVKYDTLPAADNYILRYTVGGVRKASLHINSAGKLRMADSSGTTGIWTATNTFPLNTWVRIELFAQSGTTGNYQAAYYALDSTSPTETSGVVTGNGGGTPFDAVTIGKTDSSAYTGTVKIDSIQGNDAATGFIGPWVSAAGSPVRPNALISNAGGFTAVGSADIPSALSDESDSTYASSPANPAGAVMEVKFPPLSAGGNISAVVRDGTTAASPAITRTYYIVQGTTIIHTEPGVVLPTSATNRTIACTTGETAAVTDRTDLRLRLSDG